MPSPPRDQLPNRLRFDQLSLEDGLPQQSVLSVLQDRHGFLWLATQGGVVRYDGYRMSVFSHDHSDPGSISANRVWKIYEDREGTLWLGTSEGGLNRFEPESETFTAFRHDPNEPSSLPSDRIWDLLQDRTGRFWVGTSGGLSLYDSESGTFSHQALDPEMERAPGKQTVRVILEDPSGKLWLGTSWSGLLLFDPDTKTFETFRRDLSDPQSLPDDQILSLFLDAGNQLWVGTARGLARLNRESGSFEIYRHEPGQSDSLAGDQVQKIFGDRMGNLWMGTQNGLSILRPGASRFQNARHDPARPDSLPNNSVAEIFEDRTGILWFGIWYGGAAKVDPRTWQFSTFLRGEDPASSPPGGVLALYEDPSGKLWVGTSEGLTLFDPGSSTFSTPASRDGEQAGRDVTGLAAGDDGTTWVAFRSGLESWRLGQDGSPWGRPITLGPEGARRRYVSTLVQGPNNVLWLAQDGLVKLEESANEDGEQRRRITRFAHRPDDPSSLASDRIRSLTVTPDGDLWIGYSDRGLGRLRASSESFEHFRLYPETEGQPSVSAIHVDEAGRVWVATNAGLFRLDPDRDPSRVQSFTRRDGLVSDLVAGILADDRGRLWLSTAAGLSVFDPEAESFEHFGVADGALSGGYNKGAALRTRDGRMAFGGPAGLSIFDPNKVARDPAAPELAWTALRLPKRVASTDVGPSALDRRILDRPLHLVEEIVLGPSDDLVSFEFAALHFADPKANRYAYKLEGFDRDWIPTDSGRRAATYTRLPPRRYTLKVKGSNLDGVWNEEGISLRVRVLPPFWRTWWAYLIYIGAALGLVLGLLYANRRLRAIVVQRTVQVRRQAQRIQAEHDAKARFIANVAHELRTPLTLVLGPLEDLHQQDAGGLEPRAKSRLEMALRNLRRMMGLVGQVLDLGRLEAGRTQLQPIEGDLAELVRREAAHFSNEAQRRQLLLTIETPETPVVLGFDPDAVSKILGNLVSNALKHTPAGGSVTVALENAGDEVLLVVTDTGRGIHEDDLPRVFERYYQGKKTDPSQPGTGIGLALVRELAELHGGRVEATSRLGEGSRFEVGIPRQGLLPASPPADRPAAVVPEPPTNDEVAIPAAGLVDTSDPNLEEDRLTVLVVDDNPELRDFITMRLSASYRILQAADGEEALKIARRDLPDVVVSDVMMPRLDGLEMTRRLRQDPETAYLPILLLTAKATGQDTVEGLSQGADDYLTKPFDPAELAARIAGLLAARRRLREYLRRRQEREQYRPPGRESFEHRVERVILENLGDELFSVQDLASSLAVDRTVLFRRVKKHFGQSPSILIRKYRLERAAELLRDREGNVTEVCYAVGFSSLSYFTRRFREHYGVTPSRFG